MIDIFDNKRISTRNEKNSCKFKTMKILIIHSKIINTI